MADPIPWADLTADQESALLTSDLPSVDFVCELLDGDLNIVEDITDSFSPAGGDVSWTGTQTIPRDCKFTSWRELNWGADHVRISMVITDTLSGLSGIDVLGTFIATSSDASSLAMQPRAWPVNGMDCSAWLDRLIDRDLSFASGADIVALITQILGFAGIGQYRIDGSFTGKKLPKPMAYTFLSSGSDSTTVDSTVTLAADFGGSLSSTSTDTTWRQVLNDLLELMLGRGVYADASGRLVFEPYVDAGSREGSTTFDADTVRATVAADRSVTQTVATVNVWYLINSSLPDVNGVPAVPVQGNGIATRRNQSEGPASIDNLHGRTFLSKGTYAAADQATLEAALDAIVAADMRTVLQIDFTTVPYPPAGHFDVFTVDDAQLDGGSVKVEAQSWTTDLGTGGTKWSVLAVA